MNDAAVAINRLKSERVWEMTPDAYDAFADGFERPIDITRISPPRALFERVGSNAVISINGVIARNVPPFLADMLGIVSLDVVDEALDAAANDATIDQIVLRIDSPGGASAAWPETAQMIRRATEAKPVVAFVEEMGASAAYALASQTNEIIASPTALVGSIGTMITLRDSSKMFDRIGIRFHHLATGEFKAVGAPGNEITESQLEYVRGLVSAMHERFASAVQTGRRLSPNQFADVADGRLFVANDALKNGLVDRLMFWSEFASQIKEAQMPTNEPQGGAKTNAPSETNTPPIDPQQVELSGMEKERARVSQILAAFPGDAAFAAKAINRGDTLIEAKAAYADVLAERIKSQPADDDDDDDDGVPGNIGREVGADATQTLEALMRDRLAIERERHPANPIKARYAAAKYIRDHHPDEFADAIVAANPGRSRDQIEFILKSRLFKHQTR